MACDPIKVYDARWEVSEFDDVGVRRLFEATFLYARELGVEQVTICRDARLGAARVMELALDVALRAGFAVILCPDPVSTPYSYFATLIASTRNRNTLGLTITASHNPKSYIGTKFTVPTVRAVGLDCGPAGGLTRVRELYHGQDVLADRRGGRLTVEDLRDEYIEFSSQYARVGPQGLAGLRIVLDAFHGSAGSELHRALERAGVIVIARRLLPNGDFPTGSPNPTSQGKMAEAMALARTEGADCVVGLDGDGDRIVFGTANVVLTAGFAFIPILEQGMRTLPDELRAAPVPVLYDPKVSPLGLIQWARRGAVPLLFRNGHSQIKDYMTTRGARFAAEESGHYYHRIEHRGLSVAVENSLLCVLSFLAAIRDNPRQLSALEDYQAQVFTTGEFNYQFTDDVVRDRAMAAVLDELRGAGAKTVTRTPDGIDLEGTSVAWGVSLQGTDAALDPNWYSGYMRSATNERSVLRAYFSAGDPSRGRSVEHSVREIIEHRYDGRVVD